MARRLAGLTELVLPSGAFDSMILALEIVMFNLPADDTKLPFCPLTNVYLSIYYFGPITYSALRRKAKLQSRGCFTWSKTVSKLAWPLMSNVMFECAAKKKMPPPLESLACPQQHAMSPAFVYTCSLGRMFSSPI